MSEEFLSSIESGLTTLCWCWRIGRTDGRAFGFTDHDREVVFDGTVFAAQSGLSAKSLAQSSGLSVDNTEAMGALSDAAITDADILAGRFDEARIEIWRVNWQAPEQRQQVFCGQIGDITQGDGAFTAELRGLTDLLNQPQGRIYQGRCAAVLGDGRCRFATDAPGYAVVVEVSSVTDSRVFTLAGFETFAEGWFLDGRLEVLDGDAAGLVGQVRQDLGGAVREIELWQSLRAPVRAGDRVRVIAGCDKRAVTCREKFDNFLNFRGFPHIPGEDWLMRYPKRADPNAGGSLIR